MSHPIHKQALYVSPFPQKVPASQVLTIQVQDELMMAWYVSSNTYELEVVMVGTGDTPPAPFFTYLSSIQIHGNVWHWYVSEQRWSSK